MRSIIIKHPQNSSNQNIHIMLPRTHKNFQNTNYKTLRHIHLKFTCKRNINIKICGNLIKNMRKKTVGLVSNSMKRFYQSICVLIFSSLVFEFFFGFLPAQIQNATLKLKKKDLIRHS